MGSTFFKDPSAINPARPTAATVVTNPRIKAKEERGRDKAAMAGRCTRTRSRAKPGQARKARARPRADPAVATVSSMAK